MKFSNNQFDHATYCLALRRLLLSHLSHHCGIRKCRRDRACTGPLLEVDGETVWLESEHGARIGGVDRKIAPVCVLQLSAEALQAFNLACLEMADAHADDEHVSIRVKDKAVRVNCQTSVNGIACRRQSPATEGLPAKPAGCETGSTEHHQAAVRLTPPATARAPGSA